MDNNNSLSDKTVILTGSKVVQSVEQFATERGVKVLRYPLIEVRETHSDEDAKKIAALAEYDWLIFTSQNAVHYFIEKLNKAGLSAFDLHSKIAAVGEKTAAMLKEANFPIHFMPSVYSADYFVQEFTGTGKMLFVRGNLAKSTITDGLGADEWTVYETVPTTANCAQIIAALKEEPNAVVVFASPSAVHTFAKYIAHEIGWLLVRAASIGHITTDALAVYGVTPIVQPNTYTMKSVITQIILEEWSK